MNGPRASLPPVLALLQKRFEGDDSLLDLARLRFVQSGLGPEFYAEGVAELEHLLRFRPAVDAPAVVHLARWINILEHGHIRLIGDFASSFKGRIFGMVVHDQPEAVTEAVRYRGALRKIESVLGGIRGPMLFIEYAAGLAPEEYFGICREIAGLEHVGCCIDTGHFAIRRARDLYAAAHPGADVCNMRPEDPDLPHLIGEVQEAASAARELVLQDIRTICRTGSRIHMHLHDAHPLSHTSPLGVSDHLSFLSEVLIPFPFRDRMSLPPVFGPEGLRRIIDSTGRIAGDMPTFSLEIHPEGERLGLGDASGIFGHWLDKGNAERTNHWLKLLAENHRLVRSSFSKGADNEQ